MTWHTTTPPKDGKRFLGQRKVYHFNSHPRVYDYELVGNKVEELIFLDSRIQRFAFDCISTDSFDEDQILMWTRDYPIEPTGIQEFTIKLP